MNESRIDLDLVREFCDIAQAHDLVDLDVTYKDFRLRVARPQATTPFPVMVAPRTAQAAAPAETLASAPVAQKDYVPVVSPLAGVFYRAVRPGAPAYVEEGSEVHPGQTLCIVEAMKLMNEITAETHARVHRILVENAQVVQTGQEIFLLDPL